MRFVTFSIAGSFLAAILLMALWPSESRFGAPSHSVAQDKAAEAKAETAGKDPSPRFSPGTELSTKVEEAFKHIANLNYDETPWAEVEEELELRTGLNFLLSSSAEDDSLSQDTPITINLTGIPLNKALSLMLETNNATYFIDDGVVVIISLEDAEDVKWFRLKMYDCRELVAVLPKSRKKVPRPVLVRGNGAGGGGVFSVPRGLPTPAQQGKTGDSKSKKDGPDVSVLLDKKLNNILSLMKSNLEKDLAEPTSEQTLVNLVLSMVQPDSWHSCGQGLGSIEAVNGILVVSQKEEVHQEIDKLLADLEANILGRTRRQAVSESSEKTSAVKPSATGNADPFAIKPTAANAQKEEDPFK